MDSLAMLANLAATDVPTTIADAVATRATTGARCEGTFPKSPGLAMLVEG